MTALTFLAAGLIGIAGFSNAVASERAASSKAARVDHHQHLVSPAGAAWLNRVVEASLPPEVAKLLAARSGGWNDAAMLAPLYTGDALVYDERIASSWIKGAAGVSQYFAKLFARPYRLTPLGFVEDGANRAHVVGYYSRGTGGATSHFGRFHVELERDVEHRWRIALELPTFPGRASEPELPGERLVELLDEAGIDRAVVMSDAYWFDAPDARSADVYPAVRAENDWTAAQAKLFPDRLVAFCSFNPLATHALTELERCAKHGGFAGIKLHFGVSHVDLDDARHRAVVARVFAAANARGLPLAVHARHGEHWDADQARLLLRDIISRAPDVTVQIAHLWGGEAYAADVLDVFAKAFAARDAATRRLYFDLADTALIAAASPELGVSITTAMRAIGLDRMLYGSDAAMEGHPAPRESWQAVRANLRLNEGEIDVIAKNVAPYLE